MTDALPWLKCQVLFDLPDLDAFEAWLHSVGGYHTGRAPGHFPDGWAVDAVDTGGPAWGAYVTFTVEGAPTKADGETVARVLRAAAETFSDGQEK